MADAFARHVRIRAAAAIARARGGAAADLFRLVPPSRCAGLELVAAVKGGWTAMLFVDEDPAGRCVAPGFDAPPDPPGNLGRVVRLARLTGAVILPAFVERTEGAHLIVHLLEPIAEAGAADALVRLNAALAAAARRHLDQWFMLPSYRRPEAAREAPPA